MKDWRALVPLYLLLLETPSSFWGLVQDSQFKALGVVARDSALSEPRYGLSRP